MIPQDRVFLFKIDVDVFLTTFPKADCQEFGEGDIDLSDMDPNEESPGGI